MANGWMALFEKPEERMHQFLTNSIWDAYSRLPTTTKEQVQNTLGDAFINRFLPNIDTESITNETLAKWAHYMAGNVRLQYKDMDAPVADLPPMEVSQIYQKYVTERDTRYPGINDLQTSYYTSTEEMQAWILDNTPLAEYWNWKDRYLADNLDLVPYMVSEDSRLAGVDPELAKQYYIYRAEFDSKFPNYYDDLDILLRLE